MVFCFENFVWVGVTAKGHHFKMADCLCVRERERERREGGREAGKKERSTVRGKPPRDTSRLHQGSERGTRSG